jgi:hypothetical protein
VIFRLGSFACDLLLGIFRLGSFARDLSPEIFHLGSFAWTWLAGLAGLAGWLGWLGWLVWLAGLARLAGVEIKLGEPAARSRGNSRERRTCYWPLSNLVRTLLGKPS